MWADTLSAAFDFDFDLDSGFDLDFRLHKISKPNQPQRRRTRVSAPHGQQSSSFSRLQMPHAKTLSPSRCSGRGDLIWGPGVEQINQRLVQTRARGVAFACPGDVTDMDFNS